MKQKKPTKKKGFYPGNKYVFDENGQEVKKARLTYVGHYKNTPVYTNPTVEDGVLWCINENQIYKNNT